MTDSLLPRMQQEPTAGFGLVPLPLAAPSAQKLLSIRLRLLQAEEELRVGQWQRAQQCLVSARTLLDKAEPSASSPLVRSGLTLRQKQRLQVYIEQHLNRAIVLPELAQLLNLSYSHFCRAFRQSFGQPPAAYVRGRRVERAKELMLGSGLPLRQIALECGLCDQAALSKLFRQVSGESPAAWRRARRG